MKRKATIIAIFLIGITLLMLPLASADPAFLCPVVGDGVLNADFHNGDNGVSAITPPVGTSFIPGNNKAGMHANENAHNTLGPGDPNAGPGHNPDFTPIWPPTI